MSNELTNTLFLIQDGNKIKTLEAEVSHIILSEIPVKYIRDSIGGSSLNDIAHWVELEAYNSVGTNVAKGCKVTYTGTIDSKYNNYARLVDGDKNTANYFGIDNGGGSVTVELAELTPLSKIIIWHYFGDGRTYKNPKVEISPDGVSWYMVYSDTPYAETSSGKTHILSDITIDIIGDTLIKDVCDIADLTVDTFKTHGVSKSVISLLDKYRYTLTSDNPKIIYLGLEEERMVVRECGTPFGEFIEMKSAIDLSPTYINHVRNINITAIEGEGDILRFVISTDNGVTWKTYYGDGWVDILKNNAIIIDKGMTLDVINSLTEANLQSITTGVQGLKLAWYMKKANINSILEISHIDMGYSTNL